jgi:hypothetical protein
LGDAVAVAAIPVAVGTGDDVGKPNLARNLIVIPNERSQHPEKRGLVVGEQIASWPIGTGRVASWTASGGAATRSVSARHRSLLLRSQLTAILRTKKRKRTLMGPGYCTVRATR